MVAERDVARVRHVAVDPFVVLPHVDQHHIGAERVQVRHGDLFDNHGE